MISGKRIIITCFLHCQSWKQHGFFFTCVSMSTTWRPMLDTSWLIKCKMAWKEKINRFTAVMGKHWFLQYHINKTTGKMAKRPLNPRQNSFFSTSHMISSPCYTCFTVLTLWASSFSSWSMGSSSGETEQPEKSLRAAVLCCWESTCQMRETHLTFFYSLWVLPRESEQASLLKESKHDMSFRTSAEEAANNILLTGLLWELPSPCGTWSLPRWPATKGKLDRLHEDTSVFTPTGKGAKDHSWGSPPQPRLQPSRSEANPVRAGIVSPWQPADEWWPGGLCCGWLTGRQQTIK